MPLNIPSGSTSKISFGPGVVKMGSAGQTPGNDVGYLSEDGVSVEISNEKKDILQGNPKLVEYTFSQTQGATLSFTSIAWDFTNFWWALGAGVTSISGTNHNISFGGDPLVKTVAIHLQHAMAVSGNTINGYVWKAVSDGGLTFPFGADEHSFEMTFKAQRSATDWASAALSYQKQLIYIERDMS